MPAIQVDPGVAHNALAAMVQFYAEAVGGLRARCVDLETQCEKLTGLLQRGAKEREAAWVLVVMAREVVAVAERARDLPPARQYHEMEHAIDALKQALAKWGNHETQAPQSPGTP